MERHCSSEASLTPCTSPPVRVGAGWPCWIFFFFQAEDGIRYKLVTGVQTCALPIFPMQSGSDAVLRRMHRKYRPWHYREKIEKIRAAMPAAAIGADVMVGFPGETDDEFEETRFMVETLPLTYLHVFTYSARPGTPAADMARHVPVSVARERNRILRELAAEKKLAFMRSLVGTTLQAITLRANGGDAPRCNETNRRETTEALTDNYLKLHLEGRHDANQWIDVQVRSLERDALEGDPAPSNLLLADREHFCDTTPS